MPLNAFENRLFGYFIDGGLQDVPEFLCDILPFLFP